MKGKSMNRNASKRCFASIIAVCMIFSLTVVEARAVNTVELGGVGGTWSFSQESTGTETITIQQLSPGVSTVFPDGTTSTDEDSYFEAEESAYLLPAGTSISAVNPGSYAGASHDTICVDTYSLDGILLSSETKNVSDKIVVEADKIYSIYGTYSDGRPAYVDELYVKGTKQVSGKTPSAWAQEIVSEAEAMSAVPQSVRQNYQANITRAQFAELIVQSIELTGMEMEQSEAFSDCSFEYVRKAREAGIVGGTGNNQFNPNAPITREELAMMIMSAVEYTDSLSGIDRFYGINDAEAEAAILASSMYADVSDWAKLAMRQANDQGFIQGDGNSLNPKGNTTCEQAIIIVYRASVEYWAVNGITSPTDIYSSNQAPFHIIANVHEITPALSGEPISLLTLMIRDLGGLQFFPGKVEVMDVTDGSEHDYLIEMCPPEIMQSYDGIDVCAIAKICDGNLEHDYLVAIWVGYLGDDGRLMWCKLTAEIIDGYLWSNW